MILPDRVLGSSGTTRMRRGFAMGPISLATWLRSAVWTSAEPSSVAEAAVTAATDPTTGQAIVAFVILRGGGPSAADEGAQLVKTLRDHVAKEIGAIAKPRQIMIVPELPKTRSGKIMRRLLRDVAEHRELGDVTTLTDSSVMDLISEKLPDAPPED